MDSWLQTKAVEIKRDFTDSYNWRFHGYINLKEWLDAGNQKNHYAIQSHIPSQDPAFFQGGFIPKVALCIWKESWHLIAPEIVGT